MGAFIWYFSHFTYDTLKAHSCYHRWQDFIFFWLSCIPLCVCVFISHLLYTLICPMAHLGCFFISAIENNTAMSIGVHISLCISVFLFFIQIPGSGISGLYDSSFLNISRNLFFVFYSAFLSVVYKDLPLSRSCLLLTISCLLIIAFLTVIMSYFIVVLICISITINDEHLFMYLLAACDPLIIF